MATSSLTRNIVVRGADAVHSLADALVRVEKRDNPKIKISKECVYPKGEDIKRFFGLKWFERSIW